MPTSSLHRILYVEDDEVLALLLQRCMERQRFTVHLAACAEEALAMLEQKKYDLVLVNYNLSGIIGLNILDSMRKMQWIWHR